MNCRFEQFNPTDSWTDSNAFRRPVQAAITDGLQQMGRADLFPTIKISDGTGHLDDPMQTAAGKAEAHDGLFQQALLLGSEFTGLDDVGGGRLRIGFFGAISDSEGRDTLI